MAGMSFAGRDRHLATAPNRLNRDRGRNAMSQKTVQAIIGRLLTDEDFRQHFLQHPRDVLTALHDQGFELTACEIEALMRTDRALWRDAATRIDSRLQRCSLRGG
ncbi:MAG TPA: Os1348 family NHLP clan protein [Vicinamibacterales bacterium]|nr:Os1348 family NHLP clan protein [Vicinamibacterales bacterium]